MRRIPALSTLLAAVLLAACGGPAPDGGGDGTPTFTPVAVSDDLVQIVAGAQAGSAFVLEPSDHVVTTTLVVDRGVTLTGAARDEVRIVKRDAVTSQQTDGRGSPVISVEGAGLTASGITFAYDAAGESHVVTATDATLDIDASAFTGGVRAGSEVGSGLLLAGSTTGTIADSLFFGNDQDGLEYRDDADVAVTVTGSAASQNAYSGISVKDQSTPTLTGTDAHDNGGHGVVVCDDAALELTGGAVTSNAATGIKFYLRSTGTVSDANVENNVEDNAGKGVWVTYDAVATLSANSLTGNDGDGIAFGFQSSGSATGNAIGLNGASALGIRVNDSAIASAIDNDIDGNAEGEVCDDRPVAASAVAGQPTRASTESLLGHVATVP